MVPDKKRLLVLYVVEDDEVELAESALPLSLLSLAMSCPEGSVEPTVVCGSAKAADRLSDVLADSAFGRRGVRVVVREGDAATLPVRECVPHVVGAGDARECFGMICMSPTTVVVKDPSTAIKDLMRLAPAAAALADATCCVTFALLGKLGSGPTPTPTGAGGPTMPALPFAVVPLDLSAQRRVVVHYHGFVDEVAGSDADADVDVDVGGLAALAAPGSLRAMTRAVLRLSAYSSPPPRPPPLFGAPPCRPTVDFGVVHLERRQDRRACVDAMRAFVAARFPMVDGSRFEVVPAVDGRAELDGAALDALRASGFLAVEEDSFQPGRRITPNVVAAFLSHRRAIERIGSGCGSGCGSGYGVVLEDDMVLLEGFPDAVEAARAAMDADASIDLVQLYVMPQQRLLFRPRACWASGRPRTDAATAGAFEVVRKPPSSWGTHAYMVRASSARRLLDGLWPMLGACDEQMSRLSVRLGAGRCELRAVIGDREVAYEDAEGAPSVVCEESLSA